MPDAPTPGEVAYAAYWPALGSAPPVAWDGLSPAVHRAWDAAAQAVLALGMPRVVHQLMAGVPLCGFSREPPAQWPAGHCWSAAREDVTCAICKELMPHG